MKVLLAWYSRSGTTERAVQVAREHLRSRGHEVTDLRLRPLWDLDYLLWLALSFYPGSRFPLDGSPPDPSGYEVCLLALPKWTLSCPPVNEFLALRGRALPPTAILVTCGGWDQDRYVRDLQEDLGRLGVRELGGLALKRKRVEDGSVRGQVYEFLEKSLSALAPGG